MADPRNFAPAKISHYTVYTQHQNLNIPLASVQTYFIQKHLSGFSGYYSVAKVLKSSALQEQVINPRIENETPPLPNENTQSTTTSTGGDSSTEDKWQGICEFTTQIDLEVILRYFILLGTKHQSLSHGTYCHQYVIYQSSEICMHQPRFSVVVVTSFVSHDFYPFLDVITTLLTTVSREQLQL